MQHKSFDSGSELLVYPTVNKWITERVEMSEEQYDVVHNPHGVPSARGTVCVNKKENKQRAPTNKVSSHDDG